jgi:DNA-directed RNA polymerase specialized sigma24 family protein
MNVVSADEMLSPDEVRTAIQNLTLEERTTINKIARLYSRKWRRISDHQDLLHEAFVRTLDERRKWPRGMTPVKFIGGVIQSIASERQYAFLNQEKGQEEGEFAGTRAAFERWTSDELEAEDESKAGELKARVVALFNDDPIAQKMVLEMMDGVRGESLRALSGLTDIEYENKRRKIRRRFERMSTI